MLQSGKACPGIVDRELQATRTQWREPGVERLVTLDNRVLGQFEREPVERPVEPIIAINCPRFTRALSATMMRDRWP